MKLKFHLSTIKLVEATIFCFPSLNTIIDVVLCELSIAGIKFHKGDCLMLQATLD